MSTTEKKRGRLSSEEEEIIRSNLDSKTDEDIAAIINRDASVVQKYRAQMPVITNRESMGDLIQQLRRKFFWKETEAQLMDGNEIDYFEQYWANLVHQFASQGIMTTDEFMMRDLIMVDIYVNRSARARRQAHTELLSAEAEVDKIYEETRDDPVGRMSRLPPVQTRINALRQALKSLAEEYKILQDKKDKKYEQLKSTRQLRLEKAEKAGQSFYDLVKMLDSPEIREREGRFNELYKQAAEAARLRFSQYYKYDDGKIDRPFLSADSEKADVDYKPEQT